ncbi:MAG: DUF4012 domain-containing protein [Patescibacteria group bacterium]
MKKMFNIKNKEAFSSLFSFLIVLFLLMVVFYSVFLFIKFKNIKNNIVLGQAKIEESLNLFSEGDFLNASFSAEESSNFFILAVNDLDSVKNYFILKRLSFVSNNVNDFLTIARAAEVLSHSASKTFYIAQEVEDIMAGKSFESFFDFDEYEKERVLKVLFENSAEFNGIKANIDLSIFYIEKVRDNKYLIRYDSQIDKLIEQLLNSSSLLSNLTSLSIIGPAFLGYPEEVSYLVLFQNNNELRPTGGFIGSYGILKIRSGEIIKMESNDVYHLDMPASLDKTFQAIPPEPIKSYLGVNRWFMRDANWYPDFPDSAKNIKWFYEREMLASGRGHETEDLLAVIAITPRMVTDLLYLTGPVKVEGNSYDKDNFIDVLQYEVEVSFRDDDISEWDRKNIIGDIIEEMKNKLFSMSSEKWSELLNVFNENIERKNLMVYVFDDYKRNITSSFNWGGEIKKSNSDFVMVVDANLAAFKTDRVMEKSISYKLDQEGGIIRSNLRTSYKNNGWFDWQTTRYRTYTRVYMPLNSNLLGYSGLSSGNVDSFVYDTIENPKSGFGAFISIEPGATGVLSFDYQLSDSVLEKINKENYYSLLFQKQAGSEISSFEAHLKFEKDIKEVKGEGSFEILNNKEVKWSSPTDKDYALEVFFK